MFLRHSAPFVPILILLLWQSLLLKSNETILGWSCIQLKKNWAPSGYTLFPPRLICTSGQLPCFRQSPRLFNPALLIWFFEISNWAKLLLFWIILSNTIMHWSPSPMSDRNKVRFLNFSLFRSKMSKNRTTCCFDAGIWRSVHFAMYRATRSYFWMPLILGIWFACTRLRPCWIYY